MNLYHKLCLIYYLLIIFSQIDTKQAMSKLPFKDLDASWLKLARLAKCLIRVQIFKYSLEPGPLSLPSSLDNLLWHGGGGGGRHHNYLILPIFKQNQSSYIVWKSLLGLFLFSWFN